MTRLIQHFRVMVVSSLFFTTPTFADDPYEGTESMMKTSYTRESIRFSCGGTNCAAYFYKPQQMADDTPVAAVAMAPGLGSLKEMGLLPYAEAFAESGLAVLLFDFRFWGESGGEPREQGIPAYQTEDYRHALTYLASRPEIDEHRLGIWGTSFSGGIVLQVAALDERVKVVVSQTPPTDLHALVRAGGDADTRQIMFQAFANERKRLMRDREHRYIPIAEVDKANGAMMGTDTYRFQEEMRTRYAPHFVNRITLDSLEAIYESAPVLWIPRIAPKPLLMIMATEDTIVSSDSIKTAYAQASQPKKLIELNAGHYGVYEGEAMKAAINAATDWFEKKL